MLVSTSIRPRKDLVIKLLKQLQDQKKAMQDLKAEHAGTNAEQFEQSLVSSMDQQFGQPTKIRSALVYTDVAFTFQNASKDFGKIKEKCFQVYR